MPTLQEELAALATAEVAVAPPPKQVVETSYRTQGFTFAKKVTDNIEEQDAQVAVQTCPRNSEGVLVEDNVATFVIDGPEGYEQCGAFLTQCAFLDGPFAQAVEAELGVSIVGMPLGQAQAFCKIYADRKRAARLAAQETPNE